VDGWVITRGAELFPLLVPLCQHLRSPSVPTSDFLQLGCTTTPALGMQPSLSVGTCTTVFEPDGVNKTRVPFVSIITYPGSDNLLRQIMTKTVKMLSPTSITHLDGRDATALTLSSWRTALALLPALQMVYVTCNITAVRFFKALQHLEEKVAGTPSALRCIHITTCSQSSDEESLPAVMVFDALLQMLRLRRARGTPLELLEIEGQDMYLNIDQERWSSLSGLVGNLIMNKTEYLSLRCSTPTVN
jgi:hypothetical protein